MKKLILYFGDERNPAYITAHQVTKEWDTAELPNDYALIKEFVKASNYSEYDEIVMLGVKPEIYNRITIEIYGHNWYTLEKLQLIENGESLLKTKYNIESLKDALENDRIQIAISDNAGTYYCNCAYYWMLHMYPQTKIIFVHLSGEQETIDFLSTHLQSLTMDK